ncbi:MAG: hypothetical protein ACI9G1_006039 [Pirellulaceae bacterium]|jgi:hypothetical protein
MSRHQHAISVLRQAREVLTVRLTARVLAEEIDILEDARGESYMEEITTLYNQLGSRLENVNRMIEALEATVPRDKKLIPRLSARKSSNSTELTTVSLRTFVTQIQAERLDIAEQFLATLLSIEPETASACTRHFVARLSQYPLTLIQVLQLENEVEAGRSHEVGRLLRECFGLKRGQTESIIETLRRRFGTAK